MELKPHDLLVLTDQPKMIPETVEGEPKLPVPNWQGSRFAVVRRGSRKGGMIPAGIRGRRRCERQAMLVSVESVQHIVTPEDLAGVGPAHVIGRRLVLPAFQSLSLVSDTLRGSSLAWGPVGSVGFEAATGIPVVLASSDLDIVVRADGSEDMDRLRSLADAFRDLPAAVDVMIETPYGGIALAEYAAASRSTKVVMRTHRGPILIPVHNLKYDAESLPEAVGM